MAARTGGGLAPGWRRTWVVCLPRGQDGGAARGQAVAHLEALGQTEFLQPAYVPLERAQIRIAGTGEEVDVEEGTNLLGQTVYGRARFPVNPELLKRIAKETGGESYIATDGKALAESMHKVLDSLEKTNFEASIGSFEDLFQLLLIPGVLLVGLDALLRAWLLRRFP